MKERALRIQLAEYDRLDELPEQQASLVTLAIEAAKNAYAPYSKFKVGAAFLLEDGTIVTGNNQENAAYPSGMCAERVAIWKVSSDFPNLKILKLAITASSSSQITKEPVAPCGACRRCVDNCWYRWPLRPRRVIRDEWARSPGNRRPCSATNAGSSAAVSVARR